MNTEGYVSAKIENEQFAKDRARDLSKEGPTLYTVIRCEKSDGWYVVEGDGGLIRNFESILVQYLSGRIYKS